jgi:hypothetical protein
MLPAYGLQWFASNNQNPSSSAAASSRTIVSDSHSPACCNCRNPFSTESINPCRLASTMTPAVPNRCILRICAHRRAARSSTMAKHPRFLSTWESTAVSPAPRFQVKTSGATDVVIFCTHSASTKPCLAGSSWPPWMTSSQTASGTYSSEKSCGKRGCSPAQNSVISGEALMTTRSICTGQILQHLLGAVLERRYLVLQQCSNELPSR